MKLREYMENTWKGERKKVNKKEKMYPQVGCSPAVVTEPHHHKWDVETNTGSFLRWVEKCLLIKGNLRIGNRLVAVYHNRQATYYNEEENPPLGVKGKLSILSVAILLAVRLQLSVHFRVRPFFFFYPAVLSSLSKKTVFSWSRRNLLLKAGECLRPAM